MLNKKKSMQKYTMEFSVSLIPLKSIYTLNTGHPNYFIKVNVLNSEMNTQEQRTKQTDSTGEE